MFKHCLICTDFEDGLYRLTDFVLSLVQGGLTKIVFFHSVALWEEGEIPRIDSENIEIATSRLSPALKNIPSGVEVRVEVLSGPPLDTIPRVIDKYQIDVLLVGTPIRSLWQEKIFGSTTMGLAKVVHVPLMIIRPQLVSTYTQEELALRCQHLWRYLLVPYNDSPTAQYLLEQIKVYATNRGRNYLHKCFLMWVIDDVSREDITRSYRVQKAQQKLSQAKIELEELNLEVQTQVTIGNPLLKILDTAINVDISAIAVATEHRNKLLEWTTPSFTNEMLHRCWFPLLLFSAK